MHDTQMIYDRRQAADEEVVEVDKTFGELQIAEYVVFLLALDTYMRYMEEVGLPHDEMTANGLKLLRMADMLHGEVIAGFMKANLPSDTHKKMLEKALRLRPTPDGAARRALQIRTLLSRGGASTMRAVFSTNKALQEVRAAIAASMVDDADAALDKFAVIPVKNIRIRNWIDEAAKLAGSGVPPTPVTAVSQTGGRVDASKELAVERMKAEAADPASEETKGTTDRQDKIISRVQEEAQATALKSLDAKNEPDAPVTKSQVVGIAAATVAAAMADPEDLKNVPEPLRSLDPEQRGAALTDGKVLIAAGAGAGKSTTLVARIQYLIKDRGVKPGRILACSFNRKAANELRDKIAKKCGENEMKQMSVGTMHSLFMRFIVGDRGSNIPAFGTPEEQKLFSEERLIANPEPGQKFKRGPKPINHTLAIKGVWTECGPVALASYYKVQPKALEDIPSAKKAGLLINVWKGNDVSPEQALANATSKEEIKAAIWYHIGSGLKGDIPGWRPPCSQSKTADKWMDTFRPGKERLGDLDDMVKVYRDILVRDPKARTLVQNMFDHILVDECQDLNTVQHQVFDLMSQHITDGKDGKSLWMVGDDKQAIYQFRGARPDLFTALNGKEGWKTRMIKTNYRCAPEIVECANKLVAHNTNQIPMEARANPKKARKEASIEVTVPGDNASGAIYTLQRITKELRANPTSEEKDYAVLARTNNELNDYETACIIEGIPYTRVGGSSFLEAPESKAVLGYLDLAGGTNFEKMQLSLASSLTKPDRGLYLSTDKVAEIVKEALQDIARGDGMDVKSLNPFEVITKRVYARQLAEALKQPYKNKLMATGDWLWRKSVDEMTETLLEMGAQVAKLKKTINDTSMPVEDVFKIILDDVKATTGYRNNRTGEDTRKTVTLREHISNDMSLYSDGSEDAEEEEEPDSVKPVVDDEGNLMLPKTEGEPGDPSAPPAPENPAKGLGAVQFLYQIAQPNAQDHDLGHDPTTALGFIKKLERYSDASKTLRVDLKKWALDQKKLPPEQREERPRCMVLSTVHSVKGAEWPNVFVCMPAGIFPVEKKPKKDEPPPDPEEELRKLEAERNLAYVALTRAAKNLTVVCAKAPSRFVFEAGLKPGENVEKDVPLPAEVGTPKTAEDEGDFGDHGPPPFEDMASYFMTAGGVDTSYDRRA
jgi:superfamily I DNA/RNA helicase